MRNGKRIKFAKRPVFLFSALCVFFCAVIGRTAYIGGKSSYPAGAVKESVRRVTLGESRGKIYDINTVPFFPCAEERVSVGLSSVNGSGGFAVIEGGGKESSDGVYSETVTVYNQIGINPSCRHIIGYLDSSGHGVCGIEKAFDRVLSDASGSLSAEYTVNALGQAIPGAGVKIIDDNYMSPAGIVLTVDLRIQRIVEEALAASDIECGACVVLQPSTGEIRAAVSVPEYDISSLASALNDENKPFLNRVLCAYPVGSVFKPFVAAAAAKDGADLNGEYNCTGSIKVGDVTYHCYNHRNHGKITLTGATENSCNCYFIEKGLNTSPETLIEVCSDFGFGKSVRLFSGAESSSGNLPEYDAKTQKGKIANLSFGQGELLATPLQVAAAYGTLANKGTYKEPYILKYLIDNDGKKYAEYRSESVNTATSEEICGTINEALYMNMKNGTGRSGSPSVCGSAGKTATAQTGEFDGNGQERLCTWFAGFFPFEDPKYVAVVFNEKGSTASVDCAPVFKEIAEKIMLLPKKSVYGTHSSE